VIRVAWHPLARRELFKGSDFYEQEVAGLGESFLARVERAVEQIRRYPHSGPVVLAENRRLLVSRFPYSLIYRIEPERIFILALAPQKKRPNYWARRV
jgi:plasmid stabilization system protein ParE